MASAVVPKARGYDGEEDDYADLEAGTRPEASWSPASPDTPTVSVAAVAAGRVAAAAANVLLESAWGAAARATGDVVVGGARAVRVHVSAGAALCVCGPGAAGDATAGLVADALVEQGLGVAPPVKVVQGVHVADVFGGGEEGVYGLDSDAWKERGVAWGAPEARRRLPAGIFVSGVAGALLTRAAVLDQAAGLALVAFPGSSHGDALAVGTCLRLLEGALGVPEDARLAGDARASAVRRAAARLVPDHGAMFT